MKKFYSVLMMVIITIIGSAAMRADDVENLTFTFNIDNPDALSVEMNGSSMSLVAGDNTFTVAPYTSVMVRAVAPYAFKSITNAQGASELGNVYNGTWYYTATDYSVGTINITTYNMEESRTGSFKVNVDNASKVMMVRMGTNSAVNLVDGENIVKFDPAVETAVTISSTTYNVPLYKVTLNGENLAGSQSQYYVTLSEDCVIDIEANIPDIDVNVNFSYSEEGLGAISDVKVNGYSVEGFDGHSVAAKAGDQIEIIPNSAYAFEKVTVNGSDIYWTGGYPYSMVVMDNTEVFVNAHPFGTVSAVLVVDDPANIEIYRGYSYNGDMIQIAQGENAIELSENNSLISWKAADGCLIESVTVNGETNYGNQQILKDGDVVVFTTSKIVMDNEAVVWVDNIAAADYYFSLSAADHTALSIADGYNIVPFYSAMNPFGLSWYSSSELVNKVYLNGEQLSPMYEGGSSYQTEIPNGGVLKTFLASEPVECNVAFSATEGLSAQVKRDIIVPVDDLASVLTVFAGTQINITPDASEPINVEVNGAAVEANEEGEYVVVVEDTNTAIAIEKKSEGIAGIAADSAASNAVYNLMGVKVGTIETISTLPAGVYVAAGKKIMVK